MRDGVEDCGGVGPWRGGGDDFCPGDADRDVAEGSESADEFADADSGDVLEVAGDGESGEHDREVHLDRVILMVKHRPGAQVGLGHPEGPFHLE